MGGVRATEAIPLDVLRRRLYAPGATEGDLVAYRAAEAAEPAAPVPEPHRRHLPRATAVLAAGVLVVAMPATLLILRPLAALPVATGPTPTAIAPADAEDVVLPAPQSARAAFVSGLEARSGAGLLEYLYGHPAFLPRALRAPTWGHVAEHSGTGDTRLSLSSSGLDGASGRVTVVVVLDRAAQVAWRTAPAVEEGATARSTGWHTIDAQAGVPVSATFQYRGGAPSTLEVDVPDGTGWGALVALTN